MEHHIALLNEESQLIVIIECIPPSLLNYTLHNLSWNHCGIDITLLGEEISYHSQIHPPRVERFRLCSLILRSKEFLVTNDIHERSNKNPTTSPADPPSDDRECRSTLITWS